MASLSPNEKIDLKKLVSNMDDYEDNTAGIREMKHSAQIREEIWKMEELKKRRGEMSELEFSQLCESECIFLFYKYTDIFNRHLKDEINLNIMTKALDVLKKIEDNEIDQQEGSVIVGKLFHEIYVESALRRGENLDKAAAATDNSVPKYNGKPISWREFKHVHLST